LIILNTITKNRKNLRIASGSIDLQDVLNKSFDLDPKTRRSISWKYQVESPYQYLVEETIHWVNQFVASKLVKTLPKLAILTCQEDPDTYSSKYITQEIPEMLSNIPQAVIEILKQEPFILQSLNINLFNLGKLFDGSLDIQSSSKCLSQFNELFRQMPDLYRSYGYDLIENNLPCPE
jgi:hypothetical protein